MFPPIVSDLVQLAIVVLLLWLFIRQRSSGHNDTTRLDIRLEEQTRRLAQLEDRLGDLKLSQQDAAAQLRERLITSFAELREELRAILANHNTRFEQRQADSAKAQSESLQNGITNLQKQIGDYLNRYSEDLGERMEGLTLKTDERLRQISGQVENA